MLYIVILPIIETPYWCIKDDDTYMRNKLIYECDVRESIFGAHYSYVVDLNPAFTSGCDIFCLIYFGFFRFFKMTWAT